jgi:hypothetical protein
MPDNDDIKKDRPLTPEEVEELAAIIHNWTSEEHKKYMLDETLAQATNNVLEAQKALSEQRNNQ